ncbi:MAG: divalent-cation tolerance protein CutA [Methanomicrobiales archaeon]|nr:divalent-cation tolerance protein CutA [Methanomicrobiales archaeon]
MEPPDAVVILSTSPREYSEKIAEALVEGRLAACVNIAGVRSIYRWKGEMQHDNEDLLIIKTTPKRANEAISVIREMHTYELPEAIVLPIMHGFDAYLRWVEEETTK